MFTAPSAMSAPPSADPLVELLSLIPDALLDIRYATADNPAGRPLYPFAAAFLRRSAARKLAVAADGLRRQGLRLVVYDAYRPLSAQRALWEACPDPRYVANPARGSAHNRGGAVDLGLADRSGRPLPMPSAYDAFGPEAAHGAGAPQPRANAERLRAALVAAGFEPLAEEWWHYRDPACDGGPPLDASFEELRR